MVARPICIGDCRGRPSSSVRWTRIRSNIVLKWFGAVLRCREFEKVTSQLNLRLATRRCMVDCGKGVASLENKTVIGMIDHILR